MDAKQFGGTGVAVPVVGQGTWHMGDAKRTQAQEVAAIRLGLELGLTHIDTAEMYGRGGAEEIIAAAIKGWRRDRLFLVSKVLPDNASRAGTVRAAEQSLRRLGTDYLDLYLLHWAGRHPIGDTMAGMEDLVAAGKVRFIGVSNCEIDELEAAMGALTRERLVCNQVLYNLATRDIEAALLPFCEHHAIAVVGYTPFGHFPTPRSTGLRVLSDVAQRIGRTPHQVALRFLTRRPALFAIPKASGLDHVRENAGAIGFELSDQDIAAIDAAFPAP